MTDNELRALVASIGEARKKTAAQLARTDAKLAETCARVDAVCARLDRVSEKLDRVSNKVDRMAKMDGGVSNSQGAVAEEFYYNSLKAKPFLRGMRFDHVDRNWGKTCRNQQDECDLVLLNGSTVFIFEVKYKVRESDLQRLLTTKKTNFNQFFPEYRDHEQHWGLATFHIDDKLKARVLKKGLILLQRKGDIVETYTP